MKILKTVSSISLTILFNNAIADPSLANPWVQCGTLANINTTIIYSNQANITTCQISGKPLTNYEYGIQYNAVEPIPIVCATWNYGLRIANKTPYFINSDNPLTGMNYGGFVFYKETLASDECGLSNQWRHHYWQLGSNNVTILPGSNGCMSSEIPVFCRAR